MEMPSDPPNTPPLDAPPAVSPAAMRDAVRALVVAHGALSPGQRPCGAALSTPHAWALLELLSAGPMTITTLAARLNIDQSNVSRLCERLVTAGELERVPHPSDRRSRLLRLTPAGERVARAVDTSSRAHFSRVLARLAASPTDSVAALATLTAALRAASKHAP